MVRPLYERIARRPGTLRRPEWMWRRYYEDAITLGGTAEYVAVHSAPDGTDDGFVHYQVKWDENSTFDTTVGVGEISDLAGETPAVDLALWSFIADIDLVPTWTSNERPLDDVVRLAIPNQRGFVLTNGGWDEQWLRFLDVDAALTARTLRTRPRRRDDRDRRRPAGAQHRDVVDRTGRRGALGRRQPRVR